MFNVKFNSLLGPRQKDQVSINLTCVTLKKKRKHFKNNCYTYIIPKNFRKLFLNIKTHHITLEKEQNENIILLIMHYYLIHLLPFKMKHFLKYGD